MEKEEATIQNTIHEHRWKTKNPEYLFELQKMIDLTDNIEDERLKQIIVTQIIKLDKCITRLAEEIINAQNYINEQI